MTPSIDERPFGNLPFDVYVATHWDADSSLTKTQQKRELVRKFVSLGKLGRKENHERYAEGFEEDPPETIPRDLLSPKERDSTTAWLWIRTWYGSDDQKSEERLLDKCWLWIQSWYRSDEQASEEAERNYTRLLESIHNEFPDSKEDIEDVAFESKEEFASNEPAAPGSTPDWLLSALCHCPDIFDGVTMEVDWDQKYNKEEYRNHSQAVLVIVADRQACEKGDVLVLSLNHKGEILQPVIRAPTYKVMDLSYSWIGNNESLQENMSNDHDGEVLYYGYNQGWNGLGREKVT